MIRTVVVVLTLALASTLALPLNTKELATTEVEEFPQIYPGNTKDQQVEKTGVQNSEVYTQVQPVLYGLVGAPEKITEVNTAQQVTAEKTVAQTHSKVHVNAQNFAVSKTENIPVIVDQSQPSSAESSVHLPIQPLSVVPINTAGPILQPVVVPAEPITPGRMIITAVEPIEQKNFQNVGAAPESQVPYQQVVQSVSYTPEQNQGVEPYYIQPVEKQKPVQQGQGYSPVQIPSNPSSFIREQTVGQQPSSISNYNQVPVGVEVYNVQQNPQPVVTRNPEDQVPYQTANVYTPVTAQSVIQPVQQQQLQAQQTVESVNQPYQQSLDYTPVENQNYVVKPTAVENVNEAAYHQSARVQTQQYQYNTQQTIEKQSPCHRNQAAEYTAYNVQPVVGEQTEKQGQYQQANSPIQTQQQQTQTLQRVVEKFVPYQQPVPVQTYSGESVNKQHVYSVQPVSGEQIENQAEYQQLTQPQIIVEQLPKSS